MLGTEDGFSKKMHESREKAINMDKAGYGCVQLSKFITKEDVS